MRHLLGQISQGLGEPLQRGVDALGEEDLLSLVQEKVELLVKQNRELSHRYEGYHELVQNMHDCLTVLDAEGKVVRCNPAFTELTGWDPSKEEVYVKDLIHPDDVEKSRKYFKLLQEKGSYDNYEGRILCKDGKYLHIQVNSVAIHDDKGNVIGSKDILRDITENTENRERLRMQARLDEMLSHVADLFLKDTYSELDRYINDALASLGEFFGVDRCYVFSIDTIEYTMTNTHEWCASGVVPEIDNLKGIPLKELAWWGEQMMAKKIINIQDVSELEHSRPQLYNLLHPQGIKSLLCVPMVFEGETKGFLGFDDIRQNRLWTGHAVRLLKKSAEIFTSIIENDKVKNEKEKLIKELARANDELEDFAYVVSHDLKAPIRGIVTVSSWLKEDYQDKLDQDGVRQLELLESRGLRLEKLINDILSYSSLKVEGKDEDIDMKMLCGDIIENLPYDRDAYTINCPARLPVLRKYNYTRIYQLFQNLITNAVKYNDKDLAVINVSYKKKAGYHVFVLADNGIGIEQKYLAKIFDLFQKLDHKDTASTGIGLAIVKRVVDLYDGSIHVESELGKGTAFTIRLPVRGYEKSPYV